MTEIKATKLSLGRYIQRMDEIEIVGRKISNIPEGERKIAKPKHRWMDGWSKNLEIRKI